MKPARLALAGLGAAAVALGLAAPAGAIAATPTTVGATEAFGCTAPMDGFRVRVSFGQAVVTVGAVHVAVDLSTANYVVEANPIYTLPDPVQGKTFTLTVPHVADNLFHHVTTQAWSDVAGVIRYADGSTAHTVTMRASCGITANAVTNAAPVLAAPIAARTSTGCPDCDAHNAHPGGSIGFAVDFACNTDGTYHFAAYNPTDKAANASLVVNGTTRWSGTIPAHAKGVVVFRLTAGPAYSVVAVVNGQARSAFPLRCPCGSTPTTVPPSSTVPTPTTPPTPSTPRVTTPTPSSHAPSPAPATAQGTPSGKLPATGSATGTLAAAAMTLLILGAVAWWLGRNRPRAQYPDDSHAGWR